MITQTTTDSFELELGQAIHDFQLAGDTFKIALYLSTATLDATTTAYTATGEVSGTAYTAGGETLTNVSPVRLNNKTIIDWADVTVAAMTVTGIAGGLIYNSSKANRSIAVLKFTSEVSPSAETLNIKFPGATAASSIIRIGRT